MPGLSHLLLDTWVHFSTHFPIDNDIHNVMKGLGKLSKIFCEHSMGFMILSNLIISEIVRFS